LALAGVVMRIKDGHMTPTQTYLGNGDTLIYDGDACVGCGRCQTVCPHGVFSVVDGKARVVRRGGCMECGACKRNCPANAINVQVGVGCATGLLASLVGFKGLCCSDECGCDG